MSLTQKGTVKRLCILGSTGSIGTQALDIVSAFPDRFEIMGLTAGAKLSVLQDQIIRYHPKWVMIQEPTAKKHLQEWAKTLPFHVDVLDTEAELLENLSQPALELVIMAIVGTAALLPTAAALKAGKTVGMASKEVLVAAGDIMMDLSTNHGGKLIPIDSEHAALQQCMTSVNGDISQLSRMTLTASGGPFRNRAAGTFASITPQEALKHPKWNMGPKISIDSATLMNKGLEVIEAHYLFAMPYDKIEVIVHPESIIHAMTESIDGNIIAHLGPPDMRLPIQYVMTYPEKWEAPWPRLSLAQIGSLHFEEPDFEKFPLLALAYACGRLGGSAPLIMNAANEVLVGQFLAGRIGFLDIHRGIERTLSQFAGRQATSLSETVDLDNEVKIYVHQ
jgi:1-deoxy-D-xylulose-5-phosphate reductoisomerase